MTDYYIKLQHRLHGPFETYTAAINSVVAEVSRASSVEFKILLDLGTVAHDTNDAAIQMLHEDPVMRSVFELGRRQGALDGGLRRRRDDEYNSPT